MRTAILVADIAVGVLIVARTRYLVGLIGWRGVARELRQTVGL